VRNVEDTREGSGAKKRVHFDPVVQSMSMRFPCHCSLVANTYWQTVAMAPVSVRKSSSLPAGTQNIL
jgi:hypothetical protein